MNCLQARRLLLVEPESRESELLQHLENCPECAREAERAWRFEQKMRAALQVEPSAGLESRVLLAHSVQTQRRATPAFSRWALAAGLLLALGLAAWLGINRNPLLGVPEDLPQLVIRHIEQEPHHLREDHAVPWQHIDLQLAGLGAHLTRGLGHVRYVGRCQIRRNLGLHMVLQGERGPVTVLIMPGEYLTENARRPVFSDRFSGLLAPTNYGSIAVIGEPNEPLQPILEMLNQTLVWNTPHPTT